MKPTQITIDPLDLAAIVGAGASDCLRPLEAGGTLQVDLG